MTFSRVRHGGGGRELPGDRPARIAPDRAQTTLQLQIVDLDDDPVDLEVELPAAVLPVQALRDHLLLAVEHLNVGVNTEAVLAQPGERLGVALERQPLHDTHLVAPHRQRPLTRVGRIELADRAGGGVARVHERRLARRRAALVQRGEVGQRHVHLAPHLQQRRHVVDPQRNRADRAQVMRDVLPHLTVAPRRAALQQTRHGRRG